MTGKVAWKEGLALLPQHFQRADDSAREDLHRHFGQPPARGFGFSRLQLDPAALASGTVSVREAAGVFPGGIRFDTSSTPGSALSRLLPQGTDVPLVHVFLAMPTPSDSGANLGPDAAFVEFPRNLPDSATGRSRREVGLMAPNLSLRLSTEANDGFLLLPVAQIVRGRQGQPALAEDFLPVLLDINAWAPLADMVSRLADSVRERSRELERQNPSVDVQGLRQWLECLHLRTHLPALERATGSLQIHPAELHADLLRLMGGLVFTRGAEPLPSGYDHADPSRSILGPLRWLVRVLSSEIRTDNLVKAMNREAPVLFSLQLPPGTWQAGRKFFLAIRSGLAVEQLVKLFAQHAKTAPRSKLQAIIVSALPGVEARMVPVPAFFRATGQVCFELGTSGPLWQGLLEEGFLGVYTPPNLDISSIELLIEGG
jgi:type VI secretion system protein ImpJ